MAQMTPEQRKEYDALNAAAKNKGAQMTPAQKKEYDALNAAAKQAERQKEIVKLLRTSRAGTSR
jgi:hypothetical protein